MVSILSPGWSKCKSHCPSWTLAAGPVRRIMCFQQSSAALVCSIDSSTHQGFVNSVPFRSVVYGLTVYCSTQIQPPPHLPGSIQLRLCGSVQECIRSSLREAGIKSLDIQIQELFRVACGRRAGHTSFLEVLATGTAWNGNSTRRSHRGHCPATGDVSIVQGSLPMHHVP